MAIPEDGTGGIPGLEVAALVKDVVSGQQGFPDAVLDFPVLQPCHRIPEWLPRMGRMVVVHIADKQRDFADFSGEIVERLETFRDEL